MKNKLEKFNTFIFDMDGTLIDLEDLNFSSYQKTLKDKININLDLINYQKYFAGTKTAEAFGNFLASIGKEADIDSLITDFRKLKEKYLTEEIRIHSKEIEDAIAFLKSAKENGKKLCLATSTIKKFTDIILKEYRIYDLFDVIITAEDVVKGKPDPEIYKLSLNKMMTNAQDAVVFEDAISGIQSAKAAGIYVVGIETKGRNEKEVQNADLIINSYKELI